RSICAWLVAAEDRFDVQEREGEVSRIARRAAGVVSADELDDVFACLEIERNAVQRSFLARAENDRLDALAVDDDVDGVVLREAVQFTDEGDGGRPADEEANRSGPIAPSAAADLRDLGDVPAVRLIPPACARAAKLPLQRDEIDARAVVGRPGAAD